MHNNECNLLNFQKGAIVQSTIKRFFYHSTVGKLWSAWNKLHHNSKDVEYQNSSERKSKQILINRLVNSQTYK